MKILCVILLAAAAALSQDTGQTLPQRLSDHDYLDFTLFKRNDPIVVGPISMVLRNTDEKRQRFSVDLIIDGHRVEKKNLDIKVPFLFYVGTEARPHELTVSRVAKDQIAGYLSWYKP